MQKPGRLLWLLLLLPAAAWAVSVAQLEGNWVLQNVISKEGITVFVRGDSSLQKSISYHFHRLRGIQLSLKDSLKIERNAQYNYLRLFHSNLHITADSVYIYSEMSRREVDLNDKGAYSISGDTIIIRGGRKFDPTRHSYLFDRGRLIQTVMFTQHLADTIVRYHATMEYVKQD